MIFSIVEKYHFQLVSILILMDLPFLLQHQKAKSKSTASFNPYSNGSSFFMLFILTTTKHNRKVSILILMDLPFLSKKYDNSNAYFLSFNPYSNGSSFVIRISSSNSTNFECFNPYSNGSSFFIFYFLSFCCCAPKFQSLF